MNMVFRGISLLSLLGVACTPTRPTELYVPSLKYVGMSAGNESRQGLEWKGAVEEAQGVDGRAQLRMASSPPMRKGPPSVYDSSGATGAYARAAADSEVGSDVRVVRSRENMPRPYQGPLVQGDPGVTASLWRESQSGNEPFRDFRAWQPMDLVTIVVNEITLGRHQADTEIKSKSEILTAIEHFLGLEKQTQNWSQPPDLAALIQASTQNNFKGEGRTIRQGQLNARLSAVVAEVLPSGLLRIEGEKIIAVNNEEQIMVISGLVRQRDISSNNEVDASRIAQIRIDYYGKGTVGEAQYGGWLARALRILWPF
jgi:flagellar L-ring protein precursor FlgH